MEGKNEERGIAGVSYLKKLYVTVSGITVTLMKSRNTLVSLEIASLLFSFLSPAMLTKCFKTGHVESPHLVFSNEFCFPYS